MIEKLDTTFSITGWSPETKDVGIAISTARIAVGQRCPYVKYGVGAICTQSSSNPLLGIKGLELIEHGLTPEEALKLLLKLDENREKRQLGAVDYQGRCFGYTGSECVEWAGHVIGDGYVAAGNMLVGYKTIRAMSESYKNSLGLELSERLLRSLEAGQNAGGDKRGRISAALLVASSELRMHHNLRVDDDNDPVKKLREIYDKTHDEPPIARITSEGLAESDLKKIEQLKVLREYNLKIEDEPTTHSQILRRLKFESTL